MSGRGLYMIRISDGSMEYWARLTEHLGLLEDVLRQDLLGTRNNSVNA